jgi:hypothetical protein
VEQARAQSLVLSATETTRVKVVQENNGAELFNGPIDKGQLKSLKKQGRLLITVEFGQNLHMEVNGRDYPVPVKGYGRFALD